jgi:hypothetical protein
MSKGDKKMYLTKSKRLNMSLLISGILFLHILSFASEIPEMYNHIYIDQAAGINSTTTTGSAEDPFKSITYAIFLSERNNLSDPWYLHIKAGIYDADPEKKANEREIFPINLRENMIVHGEDGAENCVISGAFSNDSIAAILKGKSLKKLIIENLALKNMKRSTLNGGALELINSNHITIKNCIIENNDGAGAWFSLDSSGSIVLEDNAFKNNKARTGGALYISTNCNSILSGNLFSDNSAADRFGGAIYINGNFYGDIKNNIVTNNSSYNTWSYDSSRGGAFYISGNITGNIFNNEINNNSSSSTASSPCSSYGGAFYILGDITGNIFNNQISNNSASNSNSTNIYNPSSYGGAFYIKGNFKGKIYNNLFKNCSSQKGSVFYLGSNGGKSTDAIIYNNLFANNMMQTGKTILGYDIASNQNIQVLNNTFINNDDFGCLYFENSTPESIVKNNIITGYTIGVKVNEESDIFIMNNNFYNVLDNLYWNNQGLGNDSFFISMMLNNFQNNYDWPPGFIDKTDDYHLSESSQNIDAGINTGIFEDMDGDLRPQGNAFDIGADEFSRGETNEKPFISILWPSEKGTTAKESLLIQWSAHDPDDDATISLYYDTDNTGFDGILIAQDISENSDNNSYSWSVSDIDPGSYWILAKIDDHRNAPVYSYSKGMVSIGVTPPDPQDLIVESAQNGTVILNWDHITDPMAISYHVYRSQSENGVFYPVNPSIVDYMDVSYGKVIYVDEGLQDNITYYYKIRSFLGDMQSPHFSNVIDATPISSFLFDCRPVTNTATMINIGGKVKYDFQLLPKEGFMGTINLSCTNLPKEMNYNFVFNGQNKGPVVHDIEPPALVRLEVRTGSATIPDFYQFKLSAQHVWSGGSSPFLHIPLSLKALPKNKAGIQLILESTQGRLGEPIELHGSILPPLENKTISLTIVSESAQISQTKVLTTTQGGLFYDDETLSTLDIGTYAIQAAFVDDLSEKQMTSQHSFFMNKGQLSITCFSNSNAEPALNQDFTISGKVFPNMPNAPLVIIAVDPDHEISFQETVYTDDESYYEISHPFFTKKGIWKLKAYWMGDENTTGNESNTLLVPVEIDYGRAIILGGGEAGLNNLYWDVTKKLTVNVYRNLNAMGFSHDMIWLMLNSENVDIDYDDKQDDIVDNTIPTVEAFTTAIKTQFKETLNEDTPLLIYLMGHANSEHEFKILGSDEMLSASAFSQAITEIQASTGCKVLVIQESCYSGSFIPQLSAENRIIATSAGNMPYQTDASGRISFSNFLFSKLRQGDSLKKSFDFAKNMLTNMGYPSPLLDDNGDGIIDDQDGPISALQHIGGQMTWNLRPVIKEVKLPSILDKGVSSAEIWVQTAIGDTAITRVWTQIIPPGKHLEMDEIIQYSEVILHPTENANEYSGQLNHLDQSGTYTILVYAEDMSHERSDPTVEYISVSGSSTIPGDFNGNGKLDLMDILHVMEYLFNQ